jgi:hypothetical protein
MERRKAILGSVVENKVMIAKPRPRCLERADRLKATAARRKFVGAEVRKRDSVRCRVCRKPGRHAHHLIYRSHGGQDTATNMIWTCANCHQLIHAHVVLVTFDLDRPESTVSFSRNRQWDKT